MKKYSFVMLIIVLAIIGAIVYALGKFTVANDLPKVATTTFPVFDLTRQIAGDRVEVIQLLPKGVSPHTYEPQPEDLKMIANSQLLFMIGGDIDFWANDIAESENIPTVDLSSNINLLAGEAHEEEEEGEEHEEEFDPHYWLSVDNALAMAARIKTELSNLFPTDAAYFEQQYSELQQRLLALDQELKTILSDLPERRLITFHDAFAYFAAEYDLEIVATIEPFPGKEPTIKYLNDVSDLIQEFNINVLFKEPGLSDNILTAFAQDHQIQIYTLDPEGLLPANDSYFTLMRYNANTIAQALAQ